MSPVVARELSKAGHDAIHVLDLGMADSPDEEIIDRARSDNRVAITYDLDFPRIVSLSLRDKPSLIVLRDLRDPLLHIALILANLPQLEISLNEGCIAVIEPGQVRVRTIPLFDND
jgi:predicted nuclease of predicted toxin-antitoxin system